MLFDGQPTFEALLRRRQKRNCTFFLPLPRGTEALSVTPLHARPAHKSGAPFTWQPPASATARAQKHRGQVKHEIITPTLPSPVCPFGRIPNGEKGTCLSCSLSAGCPPPPCGAAHRIGVGSAFADSACRCASEQRPKLTKPERDCNNRREPDHSLTDELTQPMHGS